MLVIILLAQCTVPVALSQTPPDSLSKFLKFEDPPPLSCLYAWFPPFFIQHGIELKSFIRSRTFKKIRARFGDPRAVDAIYVRSMQMTNNNTAMALLLSTIACFDHRLVGLNVPLFNLYVPLSDESEQDFARRTMRLPTRLYDDSPATEQGDRDKLQHFFGSAFLTFAFESADASERFGEFIEKGESAFIIGGVDDDRDLRSDRQGQAFGTALLEENRRFPSAYLKLPLVSGSGERSVSNDVPMCGGVW